MNSELREGIQNVGQQCLKTVKGYIEGKVTGSDKITTAVRLLNMSLKVEHMNQIQTNSDRSFALRLLPYLPKGIDRDEYIKMTNPGIKPLLLDKPAKEAKE